MMVAFFNSLLGGYMMVCASIAKLYVSPSDAGPVIFTLFVKTLCCLLAGQSLFLYFSPGDWGAGGGLT